jgi:hypothetical protein
MPLRPSLVESMELMRFKSRMDIPFTRKLICYSCRHFMQHELMNWQFLQYYKPNFLAVWATYVHNNALSQVAKCFVFLDLSPTTLLVTYVSAMEQHSSTHMIVYFLGPCGHNWFVLLPPLRNIICFGTEVISFFFLFASKIVTDKS